MFLYHHVKNLVSDDKNGAEILNSPLVEKKRETTMDFAANIEKVREVINGEFQLFVQFYIFPFFSVAGTGAH